MTGTNAWFDVEESNQPEFVYNYLGFLTSPALKAVNGSLRWAQVKRGFPESTSYVGWVVCYSSGKPITYARGGEPNMFSVSCTGTYLTKA